MSQTFFPVNPTSWDARFLFNGLPIISNRLELFREKAANAVPLYRINFGLSQNPSIVVEEVDQLNPNHSIILIPTQNPSAILPGVDLAFDVCHTLNDGFHSFILRVFQPLANLHQIASWTLDNGILVNFLRVANLQSLVQPPGRSIQIPCIGVTPLIPLLPSGSSSSCSGCGSSSCGC